MNDFTTENFKANLKLVASFYPSITEVCRKLEINRQQFTKYLLGTSFPSRYNMRRICDFFGLDEYEILLPHEQFRNIVRLRPTQADAQTEMPPGLAKSLTQAQRNRSTLIKLHGYYHKYYLSFSWPKEILRSIVCIYGWKDYTLYKRLERLKMPDSDGTPDVYKYEGMVTVAGDRTHLLDHETLTGSELTQTMLYMNYRNRVSMLTGLTMGVSGGNAHEPCCSRVVMQYIGRTVNLRQAVADCGIYTLDSPAVPRRVVNHLTGGGRFIEPLRGKIM